MVQVILPLGYPALSGELEQMIIYQGTVARSYDVAEDPRATATIFERKLLSDVAKMRGAAGKWAKSAWRITFGTKWATIIYQLARGDVNGYWSDSLAEFDGFLASIKDEWDEYAPYQATFNRPGRVFYALSNTIFKWIDLHGQRWFYQPEGLVEGADELRLWWLAGLGDYAWQVNVDKTEFIDDRDLRWVRSGSTAEWNGAGPQNGTLTQLLTNGSYAEIELLSSWNRVRYFRNPDCGEFRIYVDGAEAAIVNGFNASFSGANWIDIYRGGGKRKLRITHTGAGGTKVNLDGVYKWLSYDFSNLDEVIGSWGVVYDPGTSSAKVYGSSGSGAAELHFNFVGPWLYFGFQRNSTYGAMEVWVDGVLLDTISQYEASLNLNGFALVGRVPFGLHRCKLVKVGPGQINFSYCIVKRTKNYEVF
jgi:hypothetical protein